jgi:membrane dipeptidase
MSARILKHPVNVVLLVFTAFAGFCSSVMATGSSTGATTIDLQQAKAIHERVITLDSHVDIAREYMLKPEFDPGKQTNMKVDLEKMEQGGLDVVFFIVYVAQGPRTPEGYAAAKKAADIKFSAIHKMADTYGDRIEIAYNSEDVQRIIKAGKKVAIIGIENGFILGRDAHSLDLLEDYYQRGARYLGLTHSGNNDICDSSSASKKLGDTPDAFNGMSDFGRQVVAKANDLGMMVDVSHSSRNCMMQAIEASRSPIVASHSGVRAMADSSRNLDDKQMRELAKSGGVMQLVAYTGFIKPDPARNQAFNDLEEQVRLEYDAEEFSYKLHEFTPSYQAGVVQINEDYPLATVADFIDQVEYAVRLMGIDSVGISSDFDGGGEVDGWTSAAESFNITLELLKRGYTEEQIGKIWGGNMLRTWASAEQVAHDQVARDSAN